MRTALVLVSHNLRHVALVGIREPRRQWWVASTDDDNAYTDVLETGAR